MLLAVKNDEEEFVDCASLAEVEVDIHHYVLKRKSEKTKEQIKVLEKEIADLEAKKKKLS